jgi:hypothetical protein
MAWAMRRRQHRPLPLELPRIPRDLLAQPAMKAAAIALVYKALRAAWARRGRHPIGSPERLFEHHAIRGLVADLRRRRRASRGAPHPVAIRRT